MKRSTERVVIVLGFAAISAWLSVNGGDGDVWVIMAIVVLVFY